MLQDVQMEGYEALESIGSGSFGMIRKVRRKTDGQILARKEIDFRKMTSKEKEQLVSEVNILKDLKHPNIVEFLERVIDREHSFIYILMEYCEGGDLASVIKRHRELSVPIHEDFVWKIMAQLVSALDECHCGLVMDEETQKMIPRHILHRDLKPDNVFLDGKKNVKLGDFGLSRSLTDPKLNFAKTYVGTPYYMSPELLSESLYDSKSDIWSLGCVIYEMCALLPPFLADTQSELTAKIKYGMVSRVPNRYSEELNQVVKAMLQVDPRRRPTTTELLAVPKLQLFAKQEELDRRTEEVTTLRKRLGEQEVRLISKENMLRDTEAALRAAEQTLREKETDLNSREEIILKNEAVFSQREEYIRAREASFVEWERKLNQERIQLEERRRELIRDLERAPANAIDTSRSQPDADMMVDSKEQSSNGTAVNMEGQKAAPKPYWTAPSAKPNIFSTISKASGSHSFSANTGSRVTIQDQRLSLRGWDTPTASDQSGSRSVPRRKTGLNVGRSSLQGFPSFRSRNPSGPTENGLTSFGTAESGEASSSLAQNTMSRRPVNMSDNVGGSTRTSTSQTFSLQGFSGKESRLSSRLGQMGNSTAGPLDLSGTSGSTGSPAPTAAAADIRKFRGKSRSASTLVASLSLSNTNPTPVPNSASNGQAATTSTAPVSSSQGLSNGATTSSNISQSVFSTSTSASSTATGSNTQMVDDQSSHSYRLSSNPSRLSSALIGESRLNHSSLATFSGSASKSNQGAQFPNSTGPSFPSNSNQSYLSRRLNGGSMTTTATTTPTTAAPIRFQPHNHPRPRTAQSTTTVESYPSSSEPSSQDGGGENAVGGSASKPSSLDAHHFSTTPKKLQSRFGQDRSARAGSPSDIFNKDDGAMDWDDIPSPFIKKGFMRNPPASIAGRRHS